MHRINDIPRTYRHRGYQIEALANGPDRYNVWRPEENLALCSVRSLADAREVIEADRREVG
jgi:hypothetical protein